MSAPYRIWMSNPDDEGEVAVWFDPDEGGNEYIRADICDPTQDERVKALVEAAKAVDRYCHWFREGDELRAALRALERGEG